MAGLYQRLSTTVSEVNTGTTEYHIATVMLENIERIGALSIGEMADLCSVSKSTLSKFVRMLGFEDYKEYKAEAYLHRKKEFYLKERETINVTDYVLANGMEEYLDVLCRDMHQMIDNLDEDKIDECVTDIHEYKKVAAFGDFFSETAAINLQYKMSFYHKNIYTTTNDRKQTEYIRNSDEDTLIIIFSNSGRYIHTYYKLEGEPVKTCFNETKAKVILLTSNKEMEKDPRIDLCISWDYEKKVQNHPFLYQLLIEQLAIYYQEKYGFPSDLIP